MNSFQQHLLPLNIKPGRPGIQNNVTVPEAADVADGCKSHGFK